MSLIDEGREEKRQILKAKLQSILGYEGDVLDDTPVKIDDMYFQLHEDGERLVVYVIGGLSISGWQPFDSKARLKELRDYYPKSAKPPNALN